MKRTLHLPGLLLALLVSSFAGCSSESKPDGMPDLQPLVLSVTQAGNPLEGATIQLIAKDAINSRWAGGGVTDAEGRVSLTTLGQYDGVVPGSYKVTVYKMLIEGGAVATQDDPSSGQTGDAFSVIDRKFQAANTTPLEINVLPGVDSLPAIDVGAPVKIAEKRM